MAYKVLNRKLNKVLSEIGLHNRKLRKQLSSGSPSMYDKHVWSVSLYYSFIGHLKNIIMILDNPRNLSGVFALFRACLDCYINLKNVNNNYSNYQLYEKEKMSQTGQLIEDIDFNNATEEQKKELNKSLRFHLEMLKQLPDVKGKYIKEKAKRTNINLSPIFSALYDICSEHVHVGHLSILQFHINKKGNLYYPEQPAQPPVVNVIWSIQTVFLMLSDIIILISFSVVKEMNQGNLQGIMIALNELFTYTSRILIKKKFPF